MLPAASRAQAQSVFAPDEVNVNDVGTEVSQVDDVVGVADDSDKQYPVTATLSETVSDVIETVSDVAVDGIVKAEIVGAVVSTELGRDIATLADLYADTFPAASLAQAQRVFEPEDVKVYEVGFVVTHDVGVVVLSVTVQPVTPTLSVAVSVVIETVRDVEVEGIVNTEIVGAVVSAVEELDDKTTAPACHVVS